jgi:hypothetical protein
MLIVFLADLLNNAEEVVVDDLLFFVRGFS